MMAVFRFALTVFALLLIFFGVITMISPVPFGFIFVILGVLLLAAVAPAILRWFRRHWTWLDRQLDKITKHLPRWIARHLEKSDPEDSDEEDGDDEREEAAGAGRA